VSRSAGYGGDGDTGGEGQGDDGGGWHRKLHDTAPGAYMGDLEPWFMRLNHV
jgi:hypothetical protein